MGTRIVKMDVVIIRAVWPKVLGRAIVVVSRVVILRYLFAFKHGLPLPLDQNELSCKKKNCPDLLPQEQMSGGMMICSSMLHLLLAYYRWLEALCMHSGIGYYPY